MAKLMKINVVSLVCFYSTLGILSAQSLVSNTHQTAIPGPVVYSGQWIAAGIQTGPAPAQIDSVTLYQATTGVPNGSFTVSIYSDALSSLTNPYHVPGGVLPGGVLNGPSTPVGSGYQTYTTTQPLLFAPNSIFWIVASSDAIDAMAPLNNTFGWGSSAGADYQSSSGWSVLTEADGSNGSYPAYSTSQGAGWLPSNLSPLLFEVGGTVVPEPGTMVLFGAGMVALLILSRRRSIARGKSRAK